MKTYKIKTSTGFENYLSNSLTPDEFVTQYLGFDYDEFNSSKITIPEWNKSSGIINEIELFFCDERQIQVKEKLV